MDENVEFFVDLPRRSPLLPGSRGRESP